VRLALSECERVHAEKNPLKGGSRGVNFSSFNHLAKSLSLGARVFALGLAQRLSRRQRKKKSATFEFLLINIARLVSFHSSASITTFVKAKALPHGEPKEK